MNLWTTSCTKKRFMPSHAHLGTCRHKLTQQFCRMWPLERRPLLPWTLREWKAVKSPWTSFDEPIFFSTEKEVHALSYSPEDLWTQSKPANLSHLTLATRSRTYFPFRIMRTHHLRRRFPLSLLLYGKLLTKRNLSNFCNSTWIYDSTTSLCCKFKGDSSPDPLPSVAGPGRSSKVREPLLMNLWTTFNRKRGSCPPMLT